ncbi:MAG: Ig-like domain-containing protein, partial [Pseudomonadales bacterium]
FASAPDYETKANYTATVTASDGTNTTTQDITVNVTNVNDNLPVFTSGATFSAAENQTRILSVVELVDADGDTVTFKVSGSELTINSYGVLSFVSAPDYEIKSSYTATVTASDGLNVSTQEITVNITDSVEFITDQETFTVAENQTAIGSVAAADTDAAYLYYHLSDVGFITDLPEGRNRCGGDLAVRDVDGLPWAVGLNDSVREEAYLLGHDFYSEEEGARFYREWTALEGTYGVGIIGAC